MGLVARRGWSSKSTFGPSLANAWYLIRPAEHRRVSLDDRVQSGDDEEEVRHAGSNRPESLTHSDRSSVLREVRRLLEPHVGMPNVWLREQAAAL